MNKLYVLYIAMLCQLTIAMQPERIAIIGTGYVGLVTGTCLADIGHMVTCVDIDINKIRALRNNIVPIYEPGLLALIQKNVAEQRLHFTTDVEYAVKNAQVIFIAVGTPTDKETGQPNLTILKKAIHDITAYIDTYKIIVIKSTVPIGTGTWLKNELLTTYQIPSTHFDIISNPEFLREGNAIFDFMHPDRIVIGHTNERALAIMKNIYQPFITKNVPVLACNSSTAEAIKYASNIFLAMKICFINEIATICRNIDSDIKAVSHGIGLDPRIGPHFLNPGPGFGGSCLPKDTQALISLAKKLQVEIPLINAILTSNTIQQKKAYDLLMEAFNGNITGKTIAILGLAFKADTDDIRDSPAIPLIKLLREAGASIKAYDPKAIASMTAIYPDISYCTDYLDAITNSDAMIILTEWHEFKSIDLCHAASCMQHPIIIDMRCIIDKTECCHAGFRYFGIQ